MQTNQLKNETDVFDGARGKSVNIFHCERCKRAPRLNGKNHCGCICALGFGSVSVYWYI